MFGPLLSREGRKKKVKQKRLQMTRTCTLLCTSCRACELECRIWYTVDTVLASLVESVVRAEVTSDHLSSLDRKRRGFWSQLQQGLNLGTRGGWVSSHCFCLSVWCRCASAEEEVGKNSSLKGEAKDLMRGSPTAMWIRYARSHPVLDFSISHHMGTSGIPLPLVIYHIFGRGPSEGSCPCSPIMAGPPDLRN